MGKPLLALLVALFSLCLLPACGQETAEEADGDEDIGVAHGALVSDNALVPNALVPNALVPNALVPNALVPNALVPNALSPDALAAIKLDSTAGVLSRQFVRYAVSCAFDSTQVFSFSWTDSTGVVHDEQYEGDLGIAPGWATGPLTDETRQRLVSGCLAARVNWYGVSVYISVRSVENPLRTYASSPEVATYPNVEGAFWGNLFVQAPYLNACYEEDTVAVSRAAQRDCAVGHVDGGSVVPCGMIALTGPCSSWCQKLSTGGKYHPFCVDHPGVQGSGYTKAVITTALP